MGIILGGVSASDLIMDGKSVSLYVGGNPPIKVWPTTDVVQITLGTGTEARDQFRAALADRGLDYQTVTEIPFEIELVGSGSTNSMFNNCYALTAVPAMDMSDVTNTAYMFSYCSSLAYVPDMDTAQVRYADYMFYSCPVLTDGNVRLIGRHPDVTTPYMIDGSGLTRQPWYNADGTPMSDVYQVSLTDVQGTSTAHPLVSVTVPAGETWRVRIQGTMTRAGSLPPNFRIGEALSGTYGQGATVDFAGTVTAANSTIAMVTSRNFSSGRASFVGTVTIEQVVQITLGFGHAARDQFRTALTNRGLDYQTVKGIPFGIEVVGSGSMSQMFFGCASLVSVPAMDTSGVTDMYGMFYGCSSLAYVPDMDTGQVTDMASMFRGCSSLTDGNVRLIGRNPNVYTASMITGSGMTRFPFYDTFGNPI